MARAARNPIDEVVGRNIRIYRLSKGMSQTNLADELGLTFQQIQKYEKGTNRVGSGRLYQIAAILGVDVMTLFEGSEDVKTAVKEKSKTSVMDLLAEPQALRLVQAFAEISDPELRRTVVTLVETIVARTGRERPVLPDRERASPRVVRS